MNSLIYNLEGAISHVADLLLHVITSAGYEMNGVGRTCYLMASSPKWASVLPFSLDTSTNKSSFSSLPQRPLLLDVQQRKSRYSNQTGSTSQTKCVIWNIYNKPAEIIKKAFYVHDTYTHISAPGCPGDMWLLR